MLDICRICSGKIVQMCRKGSGICSSDCQRMVDEPWKKGS